MSVFLWFSFALFAVAFAFDLSESQSPNPALNHSLTAARACGKFHAMKSSQLKLLICALLFCVLPVAALCQPAAKVKKKYVIVLPIIKGMEQAKFVDYITKIGEVIGKKVNATITVEALYYEYNQRKDDLVRKRFREGKADIGYISGLELGEITRGGGNDIVPLFLLGMNQSPVKQVCFFTRKGEVKNVTALRGKKWQGAQPVLARYLLYKKGIDEPVDKFFGSVGFETETPISYLIDKLGRKEIDVFSAFSSTLMLSGEFVKKDSILEPLNCEDFESHWVFVARSDIPQDFVQKFVPLILSSHKDSAFAQFQFFYKMINGKFMPIDKKILKLNQDTADLVSKRKWRKEEQDFYAKYHKNYKYKTTK